MAWVQGTRSFGDVGIVVTILRSRSFAQRSRDGVRNPGEAYLGQPADPITLEIDGSLERLLKIRIDQTLNQRCGLLAGRTHESHFFGRTSTVQALRPLAIALYVLPFIVLLIVGLARARRNAYAWPWRGLLVVIAFLAGQAVHAAGFVRRAMLAGVSEPWVASKDGTSSASAPRSSG